MRRHRRPSFVIDAPVTEDLEVLGAVPFVGVGLVERVVQCDTFHGHLSDTVDGVRCGYARGFEDRRRDVDAMVPLVP